MIISGLNESKTGPPPGSAIWQQLGRLKTSMPYEPAISLTGTLPISLKHVCQEIWKDAHCNTVWVRKIINKLNITTLGNSLAVSPEVEHMPILWPSNSIPKYRPTEIRADLHQKTSTYKNVNYSTTCNWARLEATQISTNSQRLKNVVGLPWWRSGWESACQCRGRGFEPWSGTIPHATEQLGPWATITEPARLEPVLRNKRGRDSERPAHRDEEWPPLATTRESPRTETKTQHSHK